MGFHTQISFQKKISNNTEKAPFGIPGGSTEPDNDLGSIRSLRAILGFCCKLTITLVTNSIQYCKQSVLAWELFIKLWRWQKTDCWPLIKNRLFFVIPIGLLANGTGQTLYRGHHLIFIPINYQLFMSCFITIPYHKERNKPSKFTDRFIRSCYFIYSFYTSTR